MKNLHVSQLTQFNKCPHKYKNDSGPIPPSKTYKGDVLNVGATSTGDLTPYEQHYAQFTDDFKQYEKHKRIFAKARKYVHALRDKHIQFYQEAKHIIRYEHDGDEEVFVTGSPDLHYYDEQAEIWRVEDLKFSSHSWYSDEQTVALDCQRIIYPLMIMRYMDVDECSFQFTVWDKKSGKMKPCGSAVITKQQAQSFFEDVLGRYMEADRTDTREATKCGLCHFCPLKKHCPERNIPDEDLDAIREVDDEF